MSRKFSGSIKKKGGSVNQILAANKGPITTQAAMKLGVRKGKPKASKIGAQKGQFRKVGDNNLYKKRRFTVQQRRTFRARRGPQSTRGNGPR